MMIRAPADAQPVPAQPFAAARDDRLAGGKRPAGLQRIGQCFRRVHAVERRQYRGRSAYLGCERLCAAASCVGGARSGFNQRDAALRQTSKAAVSESSPSTQTASR